MVCTIPPNGGFHKWGYPTVCMVEKMEHPTKVDDLRLPPF